MTADTLSHPELAAFLKAIAVAPADSLPRLVFADWLREHEEWEAGEAVAGCGSAAEVEMLVFQARLANAMVGLMPQFTAVVQVASDALRRLAPAFENVARAVRLATPVLEKLNKLKEMDK